MNKDQWTKIDQPNAETASTEIAKIGNVIANAMKNNSSPLIFLERVSGSPWHFKSLESVKVYVVNPYINKSIKNKTMIARITLGITLILIAINLFGWVPVSNTLVGVFALIAGIATLAGV